MARKRKLVARPAEASQKQQRLRRQQQQQQAQAEEEEKPTLVVEQEDEEEEEEEETETVQDQDNMVAEDEEEEEEYEEVDDEKGGDEEVDDDEKEGDEKEEEGNHTLNANNIISSSSKAAASAAADRDDDDADEPVQKLLEPFSREQLFNLLHEAAEKHADVADRVRKVADEDPAHRKIFVHGLGWDTNAETLTSVFRQYGEIEDCKAVCDKISGKSKGYGFILFKSRKGARKALVEPQKKIGSRMTACQLASIGPVPASSAAPVVPAQPVSEYTLRKIYVSNVSADLDPLKLLNFFSKFGEIEEGPLGLDKHTGKPKGFCLFVYRSAESAKKALEESHKNFEGHILHCQKAIDGPKPGKSQQAHYNNPQNAPFQRNKNASFTGPAAAGPTPHLMAPPAAGISMNQAAPAALNPTAVGQALTALLATQGAGFGLTNLLGTLGSAGMNQGVPGAVHGVQGGYGNQGAASNISPGVMGGYGAQGGYPNPQMGQGGSGRSQQGAGHMGGVAPYMGH